MCESEWSWVYISSKDSHFLLNDCFRSEEVGNDVISDHEMWVWSEFIHGVCHSHWMGTAAKELCRIDL